MGGSVCLQKLFNFQTVGQLLFRLVLFYSIVGSELAGTNQIRIDGPELEHFKSCIVNTGVDLSYPSNETWWYDSQSVFIPRLNHPIAVAYAENTAQVQELVKCATKDEIKINPRSGGHSYEAVSNEDDRFVIDVSRINFVNVNIDDQTAVVGTGARLGRLYYELGTHRMAFPAGEVPTIGIGGHMTAGGFGYLARMYGLTADNVLELQVVDWRGEVLVANNETNEDLFFALRGGGGNFGIVTTLKLKIHPNPEVSTAFSIHWDQPVPAAEMCKAWFKWKPWESLPREMTIRLAYSKTPALRGLYIGEDGHLGVERILNESGFLELGAASSRTFRHFSSKDLVETRAWMDNGYKHYDSDADYQFYNAPTSFIFKPLDLPPYPKQVHPTWAAIQNDTRVNASHPIGSIGTEGFIENQTPVLIERDDSKHSSQFFVKEFDEKAYAALDEHVSNDDALAHFIAFGGAYFSIPEDFNAFPHRKQHFYIEYVSPYFPSGTHNQSGLEAQYEMNAKVLRAMEPYSNHMSYQGSLDLIWTTDPKIFMPRYYGNNVQRLIRAKNAYDPKDYFKNKQGTPLAL